MLRDRAEAGRMLAERLGDLDAERPVVLALPRGGVPVGAEIALALSAPLDVVLAHKIGAPGRPELAIGAVCDGRAGAVAFDEREAAILGLAPDEIRRLGERELDSLRGKERLYRAGREPIRLEGRDAIVVDDGVATGWTLRAALRAVRGRGASRVVVAVPVAPGETLARLRGECDAVVCLESPESFVAVGAHYLDFAQVPDKEVARLLAACTDSA